jgi:hypothetical protein
MPADNKIFSSLNTKILQDIFKEWRLQGHYLTGNLERTAETVTEINVSAVILEGYGPLYSGVLEEGVSAERIPYNSSVRTGAKTSKYIQALKNYAMMRFRVGEKDALRIAFAIAKKHEKEGMPTLASAVHSQSGQRRKAMEAAFTKNESSYFESIDEVVSEDLDKELFNHL